MGKISRFIMLYSSASVLAAAHAATAAAQELPSGTAAVSADAASADMPAAASAGMEDIVVTAQRRSENIQSVPVAITALRGEQLSSRGATNLSALPELTPGLRAATPGNPSSITFSIRGVGQRDINIHNEGAVALFVDDSYISLSSALGQPIFDVDRVEILKGPQGTLFGRNATGGLIHIISKKPSDILEGYATVDVGSYNSMRIEGAIGGPLGGGWSARLSLYGERSDGFVKNSAGPDANAFKALSARAQIKYDNNTNFRLLLNGRATKWPKMAGVGLVPTPFVLDSQGPRRPTSYADYAAFCASISGGLTVPPAGSQNGGNCYAAVGNPLKNAAFGAGNRYSNQYYAITLNAELDLSNNTTLTFISDYQLLHDLDYSADIDGSATPYAKYLIQSPNSRQISEEMRLSGQSDGFRWQTGLFFLDIHNRVFADTDLYNLPGYFIDLPARYTQKTTSMAGFAQADYSITSNLSFTLGGRYTRDRRSIRNESTCISNPVATGAIIPGVTQCEFLSTFVFPNTLAFNSYSDRFKENNWSGRAVLKWNPLDQVMFYGGVNRGPKAGGFNSGGAELYALSAVRFKGETLTSYEIGFKSTVLDRAVTFNGSAFYYDYKDFQTYSLVQGGFRVLNVDATVKGAELELAVRPVRGLELKISGAYLDTKQKNVPLPAGGTGAFPIPDAPKLSLSGLIHYSLEIGGGTLATDTDISYVGQRSISAIRYASQDLPAYTRIDTQLSYTFPDRRWTGSLYVRNLTRVRTQ